MSKEMTNAEKIDVVLKDMEDNFKKATDTELQEILLFNKNQLVELDMALLEGHFKDDDSRIEDILAKHKAFTVATKILTELIKSRQVKEA